MVNLLPLLIQNLVALQSVIQHSPLRHLLRHETPLILQIPPIVVPQVVVTHHRTQLNSTPHQKVTHHRLKPSLTTLKVIPTQK